MYPLWRSQFTMCDRLHEKNPCKMVDGARKISFKPFISLPEDSDRTQCNLPSVFSFLRGHSGFVHTEAESQEAQLGKREGEDCRTCEERERKQI